MRHFIKEVTSSFIALVMAISSCRLLLFAVLVAPSWLPAQRTWIVDKFQRPGFDFADLQPAVDAAGNGDIIRLRYTSQQEVDGYNAPVINSKGIVIAGEQAGPRPRVHGRWDITNAPLGQKVVIAGLRFDGLNGFFNPPTFFTVLSSIVASGCAGGIVLDDVEWNVDYAMSMACSNCQLVCVSRSTWNAYIPLQMSGANLVVTDSLIRMAMYGGFNLSPNRAAVELNSSTLTMSNSALFGSDAQRAADSGLPAVFACQSEIFLGGGCTLVAGVDFQGSRPFSAIHNSCWPTMTTIHMDLDHTTLIGGYDSRFVYAAGPQTGLGFTKSGSTLYVDQHVHAGALTVLALGDLAAAPWQSIAGDVLVAQAGLSLCFDWSVADMQLRRTFTIPPGLPATAAVAMQAFELLPTGEYLSSNVAIAGNW